jgi:phosphonate transport system substrate-binding protein
MRVKDRSNTAEVIRIGAVAYDAKVVTIWEGFKAYFASRGLKTDYVLYSNYESQVDALLQEDLDIAWNSPLAWLRAQSETEGAFQALAMRDTDRDLTTKIIVLKGSGIRCLKDLQGKTVGVGAADSPQATVIPLNMLAAAGIEPDKDCRVIYHNVMLGKHGDHVGGERDAARALASRKVDASCILDSNYLVFINEGTLDPGATQVLASTEPFDHCNFSARLSFSAGLTESFKHALLEMSFQDVEVRPYMEMEGLKRWLEGRTAGYQQLEAAVKRFNSFQQPRATAQGVL